MEQGFIFQGHVEVTLSIKTQKDIGTTFYPIVHVHMQQDQTLENNFSLIKMDTYLNLILIKQENTLMVQMLVKLSLPILMDTFI